MTLRFLTWLLLLGTPLALRAQADTLRVMHYNLLAFGLSCPGVSVVDKYDWLGEILAHERPQIFTVNELGPNVLLANGIRDVSFAYNPDIAYAPFTNQASSDRVNLLFYDETVVGYKGGEVITGSIRDVNVYYLYHKPVPPGGDTTFLTCVVTHFKAGSSTNDQNQRQVNAQNIMSWAGTRLREENILLLGDLNVSSAGEASFQTLTLGADTSRRFLDPLGLATIGWSGAAGAAAHTQSTRSSSPDCGSGGGMDDRFDFILASRPVMSGLAGLHLVPGSYTAPGNNGSYYNQELGCSGNSSVPFNVCLALKQMSDHLPVVVDLAVDGPSTGLAAAPPLPVRWLSETGSPSLRFAVESGRPLKVRIVDAMGRSLLSQDLSPQAGPYHIPRPQGARGIYFLDLRDDQGRSYQRLLR
ncbi:MAG: hypothetical protein D6722_23955 [Bacteroidetes bacterium]|nr:MAG: hypothetical protein D6722_23955 [Bacteroidota bacterium]